MTVMDLVVWIADVVASCERDNSDPLRSVGTEVGQKRFGYDDMMKSIMSNTVEFLKEKKQEKDSQNVKIVSKGTKVYMDLEFMNFNRVTSQIISIGLIDEHGRTFYAIRNDVNDCNSNKWVELNVMPVLYKETPDIVGSLSNIRTKLEEWFESYTNVEIWGDCLAYDWVLFLDIWKEQGTPKNIYYIPQELCTLLKVCGIDPDIEREDFVKDEGIYKKHNALYDASIVKKCCEKCWNILHERMSFDDM